MGNKTFICVAENRQRRYEYCLWNILLMYPSSRSLWRLFLFTFININHSLSDCFNNIIMKRHKPNLCVMRKLNG